MGGQKKVDLAAGSARGHRPIERRDGYSGRILLSKMRRVKTSDKNARPSQRKEHSPSEEKEIWAIGGGNVRIPATRPVNLAPPQKLFVFFLNTKKKPQKQKTTQSGLRDTA